MGKKYIIELEEEPFVRKSALHGETAVWRASGFNSLVFDQIGIDKLTPYTEPDLEQVRKEAYQQGLSDAWEAARKVTQVRKYGGYGDCLGDVFGRTDTSWDVFDYSASEAIEKIRQYEQEKEEQIQVGDEIETPSGLKGYVVNFTDDELVHYVSSEGRFGTMGTSAVSKTGRHFPEIASVLQKMKES